MFTTHFHLMTRNFRDFSEPDSREVQHSNKKAWRNILTKPLVKADRPFASLHGLKAKCVGYGIGL